ncbi:MAG TPA: hypothetical protein VHF67_14210 [Gaiellaceae bacterium]|nr:hypothetical protein [Gaiellaceae bacterium]
MPKQSASPDPWRDCEACGWRNYPVANENPVRASVFTITTWTPAERCGGCGEPLRVELEGALSD